MGLKNLKKGKKPTDRSKNFKKRDNAIKFKDQKPNKKQAKNGPQPKREFSKGKSIARKYSTPKNNSVLNKVAKDREDFPAEKFSKPKETKSNKKGSKPNKSPKSKDDFKFKKGAKPMKVSDHEAQSSDAEDSVSGGESSPKKVQFDESAEKPTNLEIKKSRKEQRLKKKFDFERNSRTVFVGNLPSNLEHRDVEKMFKPCGPVESARVRCVVPAKEKLAPKVALITKKIHPKVDSINAYVVFKSNENDECVKKALKMNGNLIDGHHIRVDRAVRPMAKRETLTSRKKSIFVGNLRFDIRDDDLINHFKTIGSVHHVRIVRDPSTGIGKGFAFVVFEERASVKKALELNSTKFKGREMRIKKVDEETEKANKKKKTKSVDITED